MLLLIIVLLLLFGGGGGYYGYSRWGRGGGLGSRDSHSYRRDLVFPRRVTLRNLAHSKSRTPLGRKPASDHPLNVLLTYLALRSGDFERLMHTWTANSLSRSVLYFCFTWSNQP